MSTLEADLIQAATGTNTSLKLKARGSSSVKIGDGELAFPDSDGSENQIIKTDGSGNLSFIAQPTAAAGSVYASAYIFSGSQSFSRATYAIITGWGEYTDSGSFFNATTGVFTVPTGEGGKYFFAANWGVDFNSIGSDGERIEIRFSNNAGTPGGRGGSAYYMTTGTTNMRYGSIYTNYMATLSAGDEVALQGYWQDSDASGGNATV